MSKTPGEYKCRVRIFPEGKILSIPGTDGWEAAASHPSDEVEWDFYRNNPHKTKYLLVWEGLDHSTFFKMEPRRVFNGSGVAKVFIPVQFDLPRA